MEKLFINIFQMSISASYLILAVLFVRILLRKAPKSMRSFLWLLVGIRLLVPFSIESVFSLIPDTQTVDRYIYDTSQTEMNWMPEEADIKTPVNQPVQNETITFAENSMNKTQAMVLIGTKLWLIGAALMLSYMLISWLRLKNRIKMAIPADIALDNKYAKIYQSDMIESPFLFGIINPRIYVPNHVAEEALPYVVLHEMTHRKRKDYLIKPAGFLLLSIYWFNPFVWIAYIMLCKDIELICDEKVIKKLGTSCKKEYSQALLNSAVNRRIIAACPVAFGEVSVKERVKNVLNYKKPAFWILAAAVLACIVVPVCFMTQKKADISAEVNSEDIVSEDIVSEDIVSEELKIEELKPEKFSLDDLLAGEYEMFNPDWEKYIGIPRLSLDKDGRFSFSYDSLSSYLSYGEYDLDSDKLSAVTDDGKYHYVFKRVDDGSLLIFDAKNSSDVTRIDAEFSIDAPIEDGSIFVKSSALTTLNDAKDISYALNQELYQGKTMTAEEIQEKQIELEKLQKQVITEELKLKRQLEKLNEQELKQKELAAVRSKLQGLIQELENTGKQLEEDQAACQSAMKASENMPVVYKTIEQWAQAFCDRDARTILRFADEDLASQLESRELLNRDSFGWSSPWPWGDGFEESTTTHNYHIASVTERSAKILYYAWTSDPHVTIWQEILTYKTENDKCIIISENLHFMDSICTEKDFRQAYRDGITGTMMDYYSFNGAGEALNDNAKANKASKPYADLFEPDSAAIYLLNILKNDNKVGTHVSKSDTDTDTCTVTLEFYEDGSTVNVQMIRPYGSDGIWLPCNSDSEDSDINDAASIAPYIITESNVHDIAKEDARQLETLFPNHHEIVSRVNFPQSVDLNGDGIEEKIEFTNLFYNGGDGGYALTVTDSKTGKQIPLPDGYTEESGFPVFSSYIESEGEESRLLIQLGQGDTCQVLATIMLDPLFYIYERKDLYNEFKQAISNNSDRMAAADALSGCNLVTYDNEENPVILLKTYVSGFLGHIDTLGYVITELRLQKDNTWASKHYFLLDSWDSKSIEQQQAEEYEASEGNGASVLPFDKSTDINFLPLLPDKQLKNEY